MPGPSSCRDNVSAVPITFAFAGVAVADYSAMRAWYERLLGREPDLLPKENEAAWRLTETGWLYVVADEPRAGED
jgi:hypothetical protein